MYGGARAGHPLVGFEMRLLPTTGLGGGGSIEPVGAAVLLRMGRRGPLGAGVEGGIEGIEGILLCPDAGRGSCFIAWRASVRARRDGGRGEYGTFACHGEVVVEVLGSSELGGGGMLWSSGAVGALCSLFDVRMEAWSDAMLEVLSDARGVE